MSYGHGPVPPLPPGGGGTGGYVPPPGGGYPPPPGGGGGGYPPPPPPGGGYGRPQQPADTGMAIGALIANLIGLCLCWAVSIIGIVLAIVALVFWLLAFTHLGPDLVLLAALGLLLVTGILDAPQALDGFANEGMITVGILFVVGAGV